MAETKDVLISKLKEWMKMETEMKQLQAELKSRRERKKQLTTDLVDVMKENEIDCFDVNDGKIMYTKSKTKQALNKKTLMSALEVYFQNDESKEKELSEYILESRNEVIKDSIRLKK